MEIEFEIDGPTGLVGPGRIRSVTPPLLATRDALVAVLSAHRLTTPVQCACGWREHWSGAGETHAEHVADALAGVVRDPATLADDEALVDAVAGQIFAAQAVTDLDQMARIALRALAAALAHGEKP